MRSKKRSWQLQDELEAQDTDEVVKKRLKEQSGDQIDKCIMVGGS